jgi:hypothetical protein
MHFNRDTTGKVTGFDAPTNMVRPMTFMKPEKRIGDARSPRLSIGEACERHYCYRISQLMRPHRNTTFAALLVRRNVLAFRGEWEVYASVQR